MTYSIYIWFIAVEKVIAALDGLNKGMNERLNMTEINSDEEKKTVTKQPITTRTVQTPPSKVGDVAISVSNFPRNVRMQALVKLSPIDVKRLNIQKSMCQEEAHRNDDDDNDNESVKEKQKSVTEKIEKAKEAILVEQDTVKTCSKGSEKSETMPESLALSTPHSVNAAPRPPQPLPVAAPKGPAAPPPPPLVAAAALPPPLVAAAPLPPPLVAAAPLPPPPGAAALLPPPPLPVAPGKGLGAPPPPLPVAPGKGPGAPPFPMAPGNGTGAPPPPPPVRLGAKKATSKLKRSRHLGNSSDSEGGKSKAALEEAKLV